MADQNEINKAVKAQAELHHGYLLGLQLMVSTRKGPKIIGDWMFALFRRQHLDKFLSSFDKLGLSDLPDAVACAKYHVLSNSVGGVGVEYIAESEKKAWVRFRYPRWMYDGAVICGMPIEASRGFLKGWYAHNGVSLSNPRLGFVCVSEDMSGEFGMCGYFKEYDHDLSDEERLRFAKDESPPKFNPADQPQLPADQWSEERRLKAHRNYALDYIRNGLCALSEIIGREETLTLGRLAAKLIGLQYYRQTADIINAKDGDVADAAFYLATMFCGMGDETALSVDEGGLRAQITHSGLRIVRDLAAEDRNLILSCWQEIWHGALNAHQQRKHLSMSEKDKALLWIITDL